MNNLVLAKQQLVNDGYAILNKVFSQNEIEALAEVITKADDTAATFRKTKELFAIRQFFKEIPSAVNLVFNPNLLGIIEAVLGKEFFVVKSIYFDKPADSNWFVSYHQDLTISVNQKIEMEGYSSWTVKQNQFAVQPPVSILEDNFTIRIHLDDTNEANGALKIIPKSHLKGVCRSEKIGWDMKTEQTCNVEKGGIMIMKPLLLHASERSTGFANRRVIRVEFSKTQLPVSLN